jgi:site-specific DNA recombinase
MQHAVAAIRVSTTKQGTDGDSPEAQKEQIERYADSKGILIKKFFVFLESASKEQQPMQEAINYCKNKKNDIDLFIIKSIDRFTRGGSLSYDLLKNQLEKSNVSLVDIYGVISSQQVNTLEHLGVEYKWSKYSPSKKSEILEAERSKDELRDIMSRMIGAEVRYTRLGYWMRQTPYGYDSEKIDTQHGKRTILKPHPTETEFILKMFELRANGRHSDKEIAAIVNEVGYRGRVRGKNKTTRAGSKMNDRHLWRIIRNPIYAGIIVEKWTDNEPVRGKFDGLVSIDLYNKANKGKRILLEGANGRIVLHEGKNTAQNTKTYTKNNPQFPYKRYVMCPTCNKPLLGSASRGKSGKYYPAYHCNKRGHNFRVSKADLEQSVDLFISRLQLTPERMDDVFKAVERSWERIEAEHAAKVSAVDAKIESIDVDVIATVRKLRVLESDTAIKYMEEDLIRLEAQKSELEIKKSELEQKKPLPVGKVLARAKYFIEHLDELLVKQIDPIKKAQFFGVLFDKAPNYEEIKGRTQKTPLSTGVNKLFAMNLEKNSHMVIPTGVEPVFLG